MTHTSSGRPAYYTSACRSPWEPELNWGRWDFFDRTKALHGTGEIKEDEELTKTRFVYWDVHHVIRDIVHYTTSTLIALSRPWYRNDSSAIDHVSTHSTGSSVKVLEIGHVIFTTQIKQEKLGKTQLTLFSWIDLYVGCRTPLALYRGVFNVFCTMFSLPLQT